MSKCVGIGRLLGHKFVPRYSFGRPDAFKLTGLYDDRSIIKAMELCRTRKYEMDICVRCGETVDSIAVPRETAG